MEPLTIKTPADVLSFIGHTLGFWPQESLVCITPADNHVGPNPLRRPAQAKHRDQLRKKWWQATSAATSALKVCSSPSTHMMHGGTGTLELPLRLGGNPRGTGSGKTFAEVMCHPRHSPMK